MNEKGRANVEEMNHGATSLLEVKPAGLRVGSYETAKSGWSQEDLPSIPRPLGCAGRGTRAMGPMFLYVRTASPQEGMGADLLSKNRSISAARHWKRV